MISPHNRRSIKTLESTSVKITAITRNSKWCLACLVCGRPLHRYIVPVSVPDVQRTLDDVLGFGCRAVGCICVFTDRMAVWG